MATGLTHNAQEALKTCSEHEHEELSCFCKTCRKFICTTCAKTLHNGHDWDLVTLVAKKRRKELPFLCRKIKKENLPHCHEKMHIFHKNISVVGKACDEDMKMLEERRTTMINMVHQIIDERKRRREELGRMRCSKMEEQNRQLRTKIEYLEKMTTSLDNNNGAYTDYDVIEMEEEMLKTLKEVESYDVSPITPHKKLILGQINQNLIEDMIGGVVETETTDAHDSASVEEITTFKKFNSVIYSISPASGTHAWIRDYTRNDMKLFSLKGTEKNSIAYNCLGDFIGLPNGEFIVTDYDNLKLRRIKQNGKSSVIASTKPLYPEWICITQTDGILVSVIDGGERYKILPSSRRLVQRMTQKGKVLHTYEFQEDGKTRLFSLPTRIKENGNCDICVINRTSSETGDLIVLHDDGRTKFTYSGQKDSKFDPTDVECDSKRRIIVSDDGKKCLHLLNSDGSFLRCLLSDMIDCPWTMVLCQGKLWTGLYDGTIKVYKYTE